MIKIRYILQKRKSIMHRFLWFFAICFVLYTPYLLPSNAHASAEWEVTLRVEAGSGHNQLILGADGTATDGHDPVWEVYARLGGEIRANFPHPEWNMAHEVFWRDIKAKVAPGKTTEWLFVVDSSLYNYNFTIRWDLSRIPQNYESVLIDDATAQEIDMRSTTFYSFFYTDARSFRVAVTAPPEVTSPAPPVGLWATTSGRGVATLNWLPTTEADIAGYNVYRSLTSGTDYERLNRSLITKLFYRDTGLKKGETYYYVITAVNTSGGESGDSNEVEVIVAKGKAGKGK